MGLSVYNDKNESLGSINDLLTDKSGKIVAVVIGVGGFLGVGEHLVAVPYREGEVRQRADRLYRRLQRAGQCACAAGFHHDHGRCNEQRAACGEAQSLVS